MKRVRLKRNKSLALYQTFTDSGHPIGFEITRSTARLNPVITALPAHVSVTNARTTFNKLFAAIILNGPRLRKDLITWIVTGRGISRRGKRDTSR